MLAEKLPVNAQRDVPESHPNSSPTFWVACCTTIPPSPVVLEPDAININLSDTSRLDVFWNDAVPCTVRLFDMVKFPGIVTFPPAALIVKSPVVVVIVLSLVTPTVMLPAVTPANEGLSVVSNPNQQLNQLHHL